ncbi:MAG: ComF family protein [Acidimicrobiales bacterium]
MQQDRSEPLAVLDPRPVGFPGCAGCPYRLLDAPRVCLACLDESIHHASAVEPVRDGDPVRCAACSHPLRRRRACPLVWCGRGDRGWSVVFDVGPYRGGLRRAVLRYKYGRQLWWAGVLGRLVAGYLESNVDWFEGIDVLTSVPAYRGPGARRRWDPVGALLDEASALLGPGWPIDHGLVVKCHETPALSGRDRTDRIRAASSLRGALLVPDPERVSGRRILVLDDVLAEGSTLREVAAALREAGAREVAGLVVARAQWVGSPAARARAR